MEIFKEGKQKQNKLNNLKSFLFLRTQSINKTNKIRNKIWLCLKM